jgi:ppGpp synthetase/RelA/SpoT-type nucleotidyltranferase
LRAGEALKGDLVWSPESRLNILEVFQIANNFRDAHAYPMGKLRLTLRSQIKRLGQDGHTVARLKRMPSIRRKLRTQGWQLNQIHDLAGCRAILPSIDDVNRLVEAMRGIPHALHREYPYIQEPKDDGYRCHHMVFKFRGKGDESYYNDRRLEIQIRTRLQHAWATAVEAIGLFRGEDIKGGGGGPRMAFAVPADVGRIRQN